jgi:bacterioferritin-associated ferredoxin
MYKTNHTEVIETVNPAQIRGRRMCLCMDVKAEAIERLVRGGVTSFEEIQKITHCSTGCGMCENKIREFIKTALTLPEE